MPSDVDDSSVLLPSGVTPQSEVDAELAAMLSWAAVKGWTIGSWVWSAPHSTSVPFFPEVHKEILKSVGQHGGIRIFHGWSGLEELAEAPVLIIT